MKFLTNLVSRAKETFHTQMVPLEKVASKSQAELTNSGPSRPDEDELLLSSGKLTDLVNIPNNVMQILGEYGKVLAKEQRLIRPISLLPYPKEVIKHAIETALQYAEDREVRQHLNAALFALEDFVPDEKVPEDPEKNSKAWWDTIQARHYEGKKG